MVQISDKSQKYESILSNNNFFYPSTYKSSLTIKLNWKAQEAELENSKRDGLFVPDSQKLFIELINYLNKVQKYNCVRISLNFYSILYNEHSYTFYFDTYDDAIRNDKEIAQKLANLYQVHPVIQIHDETQGKKLPKLMEKKGQRR
ncbi:hypothetical protein TVAG_252640 [Trichomonas vaginalis G3]|uniref:Uncharacterized protein n=1 Tax=Trichomonas vaginalis (strain ATCC PRA-98 / G3) TaxID=412133 RepID=A2DW06_TRIV3|nr:hypothetical protein TVAGG3_0845330 [Trichomonas vaginalis G3]EAY15451.1 hypothetical protein TVAG_252640 [Trichomonas vaginalis G3]KAI5499564.1 hypothetical protein TVAGG3_0845330 [Trichomonas vaginalis G3]|eukprot:XP_001327674.1 hypothetical protein [Trichomonas vaginalis G3]